MVLVQVEVLGVLHAVDALGAGAGPLVAPASPAPGVTPGRAVVAKAPDYTGRAGLHLWGARRQGDKETRRQGDKEARRQGAGLLLSHL